MTTLDKIIWILMCIVYSFGTIVVIAILANKEALNVAMVLFLGTMCLFACVGYKKTLEGLNE